MATETLTISERYVTMSHGRTHYFEAGSGHPLILLHGSGIEQGGADFLRSLPVLAGSFRVLAPDFVGWPPGDTFANIASFPYLVDFVREFQDALAIKSSHIVGVSMGGWIAALLAYESPERVDKVVIGGNPGLHGSPNRRMANWKPPADEEVSRWVQDATEGISIDGKTQISDKLAKLHEAGVAEAFGRIMSHMADDANRKRYALDRRLPHLRVPALFLFGKTDGNVDQAETWRELTPGSQVLVVDAGHRMHIEAPELFANSVAQFLK